MRAARDGWNGATAGRRAGSRTASGERTLICEGDREALVAELRARGLRMLGVFPGFARRDLLRPHRQRRGVVSEGVVSGRWSAARALAWESAAALLAAGSFDHSRRLRARRHLLASARSTRRAARRRGVLVAPGADVARLRDDPAVVPRRRPRHRLRTAGSSGCRSRRSFLVLGASGPGAALRHRHAGGGDLVHARDIRGDVATPRTRHARGGGRQLDPGADLELRRPTAGDRAARRLAVGRAPCLAEALAARGSAVVATRGARRGDPRTLDRTRGPRRRVGCGQGSTSRRPGTLAPAPESMDDGSDGAVARRRLPPRPRSAVSSGWSGGRRGGGSPSSRSCGSSPPSAGARSGSLIPAPCWVTRCTTFSPSRCSFCLRWRAFFTAAFASPAESPASTRFGPPARSATGNSPTSSWSRRGAPAPPAGR